MAKPKIVGAGVKLGVVIPLYNDPNLVNCVTVLMRQLEGLDAKVIVCDSSPKPIDYKRYGVFADPRIYILRYPGTIGEARDRGVRFAKDRDVILNLDSDCIPAPDWVERYVKELISYDLVYGVYRTKGYFLSNFLISLGIAPLGGNMGYKRVVWEKVGGFVRDRYEDLIFLKKAQTSGFKVRFDSNIGVVHLRPHGLGRTIRDDILKGVWVWLTTPRQKAGEAEAAHRHKEAVEKARGSELVKVKKK
ncbi:MAG: glycosyltransferase family A protein [Candidatus Micrarchaeota archaeon]|nr:glycosyltransferase family A protein [Candidatus Micrarchaeota archaeon]